MLIHCVSFVAWACMSCRLLMRIGFVSWSLSLVAKCCWFVEQRSQHRCVSRVLDPTSFEAKPDCSRNIAALSMLSDTGVAAKGQHFFCVTFWEAQFLQQVRPRNICFWIFLGILASTCLHSGDLKASMLSGGNLFVITEWVAPYLLEQIGFRFCVAWWRPLEAPWHVCKVRRA